MNLLDKAIRAISPERALKRYEARRKLEILNSGYSRHGGSYAKKSLIGWLSGGSDADADIVDQLSTLRNRSRDLYMGSPLATGALKTVRTNVVGSGLALNAQPQDAHGDEDGRLHRHPSDTVGDARPEFSVEEVAVSRFDEMECDEHRECEYGHRPEEKRECFVHNVSQKYE